MKQPIRMNAEGASTIRPFGTYQPPSETVGRTDKPKNYPEPKISRTSATTISTSP